MKGILAACAALVLVVGGTSAQDKKVDAGKLVGKWELTKSSDENAPKGATVEFTKDNKLTVTIDIGGKKLELMGTYKVDGDKITVKIKSPDGGKEEEDTDTIKELSDEKMVLIDKNKKETEFAKMKK
ncbi:MAG TPA: TIGR03066 family protein [Gemmataceae bacterium]|nr:TIGR03066 family protein [Gemmataceae bacterium]